jgi:hypothetical protein
MFSTTLHITKIKTHKNRRRIKGTTRDVSRARSNSLWSSKTETQTNICVKIFLSSQISACVFNTQMMSIRYLIKRHLPCDLRGTNTNDHENTQTVRTQAMFVNGRTADCSICNLSSLLQAKWLVLSMNFSFPLFLVWCDRPNCEDGGTVSVVTLRPSETGRWNLLLHAELRNTDKSMSDKLSDALVLNFEFVRSVYVVMTSPRL